MFWVLIAILMAAPCALAAAPDTGFQIRVSDDPPVRFPVRRFSVRQTAAIYFAGRHYAYCDVVPWDSPLHPNSYNTSIHAYSSDDGLHWRYEGEVLPKGKPGEWDYGGVATPGACVANGKILLAYSGRQRRDGGGERSIGLAEASHPLGPFQKKEGPILKAQGHLDDPQLVTWPGDDPRALLYFRWAAGSNDYRIRLVETRNAGETWSDPVTVLQSHGHIRAMEAVDAKWFGDQLVLAVIEHFYKGPQKVALYASLDGHTFVPCREKYINDYLKLPMPFAFGPNLTFIPGADGRIHKIALAGFTDAAGHYTQFVYGLRGE